MIDLNRMSYMEIDRLPQAVFLAWLAQEARLDRAEESGGEMQFTPIISPRIWINEELDVAIDNVRHVASGLYLQHATVTAQLKHTNGTAISNAQSLTREVGYTARYHGTIDNQHTNSLVEGTDYDLHITVVQGAISGLHRFRLPAAYSGE